MHDIHACGRTRRLRGRRSQRGSALIEYTIVAFWLVLVLLVADETAGGNVISALMKALRDAYASFVYALSAAWL
jgi:Flp pilus assembly protein TadG